MPSPFVDAILRGLGEVAVGAAYHTAAREAERVLTWLPRTEVLRRLSLAGVAAVDAVNRAEQTGDPERRAQVALEALRAVVHLAETGQPDALPARGAPRLSIPFKDFALASTFPDVPGFANTANPAAPVGTPRPPRRLWALPKPTEPPEPA